MKATSAPISKPWHHLPVVITAEMWQDYYNYHWVSLEVGTAWYFRLWINTQHWGCTTMAIHYWHSSRQFSGSWPISVWGGGWYCIHFVNAGQTMVQDFPLTYSQGQVKLSVGQVKFGQVPFEILKLTAKIQNFGSWTRENVSIFWVLEGPGCILTLHGYV